MNTVWDEWVAAGATPPRATVEAKLANPACLVEVVRGGGAAQLTHLQLKSLIRWPDGPSPP